MWIYLPACCRPFPSAPAGEDSTLDSTWRWPMLARSVTWSGKPSLFGVWKKRCVKVSWMTLLSGRILPHSTARRGATAWIASLRAGRARPTRRPASASAPLISVTCGPMFSESSKRFVLDCSLERTSQGLLLTPTASPDALETSRALATELRRLSSQRRTWARAMSASGASYWPTPDAAVLNDGQTPTARARRRAVEIEKGYNGNGGGEPLAFKVTTWPTPATDSFRSRGGEGNVGGAGGGEFAKQATQWASPKATDSEQGPASTYARGNAPLNGEAANWPTPTAEDSESSGNRNLPGAGNTLSHALRAHAGTSLVDATCRSLPLDQPAPTGDGSSSVTPASRRRLNPRFVSWLMGWPDCGGTISASSETASSRFRRRMASALSGLVER